MASTGALEVFSEKTVRSEEIIVAVKAVRGFKDILPGQSENWRTVEEVARDVFESFGLREIRTPILENTDVFVRSIGEHTDIVEKEMYTFSDRNGDSLTLRPEATAGIVRAAIEHKLYAETKALKLFTMGPMFRHERPQKGRLRQFHQINVEILGTDSPLSDAEVIWMAWDVLQELGAKDLRLELNSLGCPLCRSEHRKNLNIYLDQAFPDLCEDCQRRSKTNPLRIFDCKNEQCKDVMSRAPLIKHYLCPECTEHFGRVLDVLEGVEIPFVINPYLVRGLDYYVRTTFEIVSSGLGAQNTVAAGGRYDGLVKSLGGPDIPGVGMAIGMERLLLLLNNPVAGVINDLFVAALGREAREEVMPWIRDWRRLGLRVQMSYDDKSLKAQLKQAHRLGSDYVLIVGEDELEKEEIILRDMNTKEQITLPMDEVVSRVEDLFNRGEE